MAWIPALEYNLGHPHPKNRVFLLVTLAIFLPLLPIILLVNLATVASQQVPSLQPTWQPDNLLLEGWWGTHRPVPRFFRPKAPLCDPKTLSRGDTFQVASSLFDYTVLSVWNAAGKTTDIEIKMQKPTLIEYQGQEFSHCFVNNTRFDYNVVDATQTVILGITCPESDDYPIRIWLETKAQFSRDIFQDFVGRRYGRNIDLSNLPNKDSPDYQTAVLAALDVISADSLSIIVPEHLSVPALSLSMIFTVRTGTDKLAPINSTITYLNGTTRDLPVETVIEPSILNLISVVHHAVSFDLMSTKFPNLFRNASVLRDIIVPNLAPEGTTPFEWIRNGNQTYYYGALPSGYQTWAQALLDGKPVQIVNPTGQPSNSSMDTTYLCPMYQTKPMSSLLSSVFVGTATMAMSAWGVWIFLTAIVAKRMVPPYIQCHCAQCKKRESCERENHVPNTADPGLPTPGDEDEEKANFDHTRYSGPDTLDRYPTSLSEVKRLSRAGPASVGDTGSQ